MSRRIVGFLFGIFILTFSSTIFSQSDPNDSEGCKDPSIFSRMKGFHIYRCDDIEFDRFEFQVSQNRTEAVEGHHYFVVYYANEGITFPGPLQITRNYTNAATAIGGKKIYEYEDGGLQIATLKIIKDKKEVWARIEGGGNGMYNIHIIEKEAMEQVVVADASKLANEIKESGKVAVYEIYFDTDKADIKPESDAALKEIAKMIKANPKKKLFVVGHTDNSGTFDHNIKLSKDRADAVVKELTSKYSVSASLLQPFGAGPTSPVASNTTEEGRAMNRRVELVAQ
ncbi:MAG: OmpA family protein [bacterium]